MCLFMAEEQEAAYTLLVRGSVGLRRPGLHTLGIPGQDWAPQALETACFAFSGYPDTLGISRHVSL